MARIISVHSFRGGTGKSNTTANIATLLAADGLRVGVLDADVQSPGIHVLFGLKGHELTDTLNDYLAGNVSIARTAHRVLADRVSGELYLIPSSIRTDEIVHVLREGYDVRLLTVAIRELIEELNLDVLFIDTHPGLNEETLFSLAISTSVVIVMRPDQQDYEGTGVTVEVARSLEVPQIAMIVNKTPADLDPAQIRAQVEATYGAHVSAVLPHSDRMMQLGSSGVFALEFPDDPITEQLRRTARELIAASEVAS
jgi:MinD-like ATPase involved in chromosome partitioning or flagellar assembly